MKQLEYKGQTILLDDRIWEGLPVVKIGEAVYRIAPAVKLEMVMEGDEFRITSGAVEIVDRCDTCLRADFVEVVAHSVEEAVEFGWLLRDEVVT